MVLVNYRQWPSTAALVRQLYKSLLFLTRYALSAWKTSITSVDSSC